MLGRTPRLGHRTMRWLIISLMLINGIQLVLLQLAINSSALYHVSETWTYVALSLAALLLSTGLIAFAFLRGRGKGSQIVAKPSTPASQGTVSSNESRSRE
jgi:hypothetical protein